MNATSQDGWKTEKAEGGPLGAPLSVEVEGARKGAKERDEQVEGAGVFGAVERSRAATGAAGRLQEWGDPCCQF